jgi:acyl carrier protein
MITDLVRGFLMREFFRGEPVDALGFDVPLITSGLLDSVATLKLVLFLEAEFHVAIDSADISDGQLDTIRSIEVLISRKQNAQATD